MITEEALIQLDDLPHKETMRELRRIGRLPLERQPLGAGVWGTAYRRGNQLPRAHRCISRGILLARELGQDTGDLLQRASAVAGFSGDLELALKLACEAETEHARVGRLPGAGRALVDQGLWLYHLNRKAEAEYKYTSAGNLLRPSDGKNQTARSQGLAILAMEDGRIQEGAKHWNDAARAVKSCAKRYAVTVLWAGVRFFYLAGNQLRAEEELLWLFEAHLELEEIENAAIALLERAQLLLSRGALSEAAASAKLAGRLSLGKASLSPPAEAALVELLKVGESASIEAIHRALRKVRAAQGQFAPTPVVAT